VLYAGRVSREKGLDLLIPLSALFKEYNIAHRFIVVGDGPIRRELEQRCPDAVFTGSVSHDDVAIAMASADLFLFPSGTDTAGNVVLEAQACGLPVVVANAGGPKENMEDGASGYVCRAGDPEDFCLRLTQLLRDGARRAAMSTAARRFAESRSWSAALQPLYSLYRNSRSAAAAATNESVVISTGSAGAASGA
jgi:glycosyltransferase involved in cell wall biosynthesis